MRIVRFAEVGPLAVLAAGLFCCAGGVPRGAFAATGGGEGGQPQPSPRVALVQEEDSVDESAGATGDGKTFACPS